MKYVNTGLRGSLRPGLCLAVLVSAPLAELPAHARTAVPQVEPGASSLPPPVTIRPPSSAENPAPPPVTTDIVPPVTTTIFQPSMPVLDIGRVAAPVAGPPSPYPASRQQPLPASTPADGAAAAAGVLPPPTDHPMTLDRANDPILSGALQTAPPEEFRRLVVDAVQQHPALAENEGYAKEARYARNQQIAQLYPSAEIDVPGFRVLGRQFAGQSIDNIVERTRADQRFDALATLNQLITDFGATSNRVKAAGERLRAAGYGVDNAADQVALNTIAAWYDVYALRTVLALTNSYRRDSEANRGAIQQRIAGGASAPADAALIENAIANLDIRIARFRQQLASAEARFRELTGSPPPDGLLRAPELGTVPTTITAARDAAATTAETQAALAQAQAATRDARAAQRDQLPTVSASLNGGRYGLIESNRDYDVVARITLRQRLFGGLPQRAKGAVAHAEAMDARAGRISQENARDAETAFSDLQSLEEQAKALENSYVATLRTRDATIERFRYSRGTLFDVLNASDTFYAAAVGYIQAVAQRDAARYVLLSRTGKLLDAFGIPQYDVRKLGR
jgi:adhesin transport system outer membrane protein